MPRERSLGSVLAEKLMSGNLEAEVMIPEAKGPRPVEKLKRLLELPAAWQTATVPKEELAWLYTDAPSPGEGPDGAEAAERSKRDLNELEEHACDFFEEQIRSLKLHDTAAAYQHMDQAERRKKVVAVQEVISGLAELSAVSEDDLVSALATRATGDAHARMFELMRRPLELLARVISAPREKLYAAYFPWRRLFLLSKPLEVMTHTVLRAHEMSVLRQAWVPWNTTFTAWWEATRAVRERFFCFCVGISSAPSRMGMCAHLRLGEDETAT